MEQTPTTEKRLCDILTQTLYFCQFKNEEKTFSVWINRAWLPRLSELAANNRLLPIYKEKYFPTYKSYTSSFITLHGFNDCGIIKDGSQSHIELSFKLTPISSLTGETCKTCSGSGEDLITHGQPCFDCRGGKKEILHDSTSLYAITNTLSLLFSYLDAVVDDKDFVKIYPSQPYMLKTITYREMNGFAFGGSAGPTLLQNMKKYFDKIRASDKLYSSLGTKAASCDEAGEMMIEMQKFLTMQPEKEPYYFSNTYCLAKENGHFLVQTEGTNGCHVYSSDQGMDLYWHRDGGACISEHNIDTPFQQIVLLAGLARFSEIVLLE